MLGLRLRPPRNWQRYANDSKHDEYSVCHDSFFFPNEIFYLCETLAAVFFEQIPAVYCLKLSRQAIQVLLILPSAARVDRLFMAILAMGTPGKCAVKL